MRRRDSLILWSCFVLCLLGLVLAMGWSTRTILRLQEDNVEAREAADMEETIRAAIWRMDSLASTLIYQESLRPTHEYQAFSYARDGLVFTGDPACPTPPMPSPLIEMRPAYVTIYFTCQSPDALGGEVAGSPQVPSSNEFWQIRTETESHRETLRAVTESCACEDLGGVLAEAAVDQNMRALWVGDAEMLVFARRVQGAWGEEIQAAWIDWPTLATRLETAVRELLPEVRLQPLLGDMAASPQRMLAALPVAIVPGVPTQTAAMGSDLKLLPVRGALWLSWGSLALAAGAIGLLLWGLLRLSRRRGDFVTAVTHELRTPLTGLQLNTELLASGMVQEPARERELAELAHRESIRLGQLVENVLSYAQVERGQAGRQLTRVWLPDLVDGMVGRLRQRVELDGFQLVVEHVNPTEVRADAMAVEQVLTNFIDNACKYGASEAEPVIWLVTDGEGIEVRDRGPGVSRGERRRLFRAFQKSAASASPGVGLGLALCRKLAGQCEGEVGIGDREGFGGVFWFRLSRA